MNHNLLAAAQAQLLAGRGVPPHVAAHLMSLSPSAVHIDTALQNFLIRYDNREYIADRALPVVPVQKRSDRIFEFPVETMQNLANVQLAGSRARPSEIAYSLNNTRNYSVKDYGLIDFVSADEEANADAPLQPRLQSTEILANFLQLSREYRCAAIVFGSGNYGVNTSALAGAARWDTATSTPVADIFAAIEACFVRPTHLVIGAEAWIKLRNNPDLTRFVTGRASTSSGAVPFFVDEEMVAKAFGLEGVLVGRAKYNSAREGATPVSAYVWGKSAALIRVEAMPNPRATKCFGYTFRFGGRAMQNQVLPELVAGVRGGVYVKITHSDDESVIAGGTAGYLYQTVIS